MGGLPINTRTQYVFLVLFPLEHHVGGSSPSFRPCLQVQQVRGLRRMCHLSLPLCSGGKTSCFFLNMNISCDAHLERKLQRVDCAARSPGWSQRASLLYMWLLQPERNWFVYSPDHVFFITEKCSICCIFQCAYLYNEASNAVCVRLLSGPLTVYASHWAQKVPYSHNIV